LETILEIKRRKMENFRIGVDIGGTFTDVVFLSNKGSVLIKKVASTPEDYSKSVIQGISEGINELNIKASEIIEINHGFTVATNAILEGKGERIALITTKGFRDVLEIARLRTPSLYDLYYQKPTPLVERKLRFEVDERVNFKGEILKELDYSSLKPIIEKIQLENIQSVAICLLHSYANSKHESEISNFLKSIIPNINLSVSSEILPEMREYERTSTTVINAYIRPVVKDYLQKLNSQLSNLGFKVPLTIMQSNGGLSPVNLVIEKPIFCIESGPAAGVVGAFHLGKHIGIENFMTFDMGGTTAKASIIENGEMLLAPEYEVGGGMNAGHRLLKGSGYILRVPSIDIAEVSSGGGSIAWIDKAESIQIGPKSSGANPGPACYDKGGDSPTVTDANVILGYLNPENLLGGNFPINSTKANKIISEKISKPLGIPKIESAWGIHLLVNSNMGRALRAVSSERGRDPRKFTLIAFGGGGPIHATGIAESLGMSKILIPPSPGVFSAFGLLFANVEYHLVKTHFHPLNNLNLDQTNQLLSKLISQGKELLISEGFNLSQQEIVIQLDMKYVGQTSELTISMPNDSFSNESINNVKEIYMNEHEKTFGYKVDEPMQLVNMRIIARGISSSSRIPDQINIDQKTNQTKDNQRNIYFGKKTGWITAPIIDRLFLNKKPIQQGPIIIEEYDSTTIVPPNWNASLDSMNNIILEKIT